MVKADPLYQALPQDISPDIGEDPLLWAMPGPDQEILKSLSAK